LDRFFSNAFLSLHTFDWRTDKKVLLIFCLLLLPLDIYYIPLPLLLSKYFIMKFAAATTTVAFVLSSFPGGGTAKEVVENMDCKFWHNLSIYLSIYLLPHHRMLPIL